MAAVGSQFGRGDATQVEALGARQHRRQDLVRFGGGEHEHHVLGRFLDRLQERVPRRVGQHVALVHDVDLEARLGGREGHAVAQVADVVHAVVGRRVDLDDVGAAPLADRHDDRVVGRRCRGRPRAVVQGHRQQAGRGRLPGPPRAREQVRVVPRPGVDGPRQRRGHVVLPDDLGERAGAVLAVQRDVRHRVALPVSCRTVLSSRAGSRLAVAVLTAGRPP